MAPRIPAGRSNLSNGEDNMAFPPHRSARSPGATYQVHSRYTAPVPHADEHMASGGSGSQDAEEELQVKLHNLHQKRESFYSEWTAQAIQLTECKNNFDKEFNAQKIQLNNNIRILNAEKLNNSIIPDNPRLEAAKRLYASIAPALSQYAHDQIFPEEITAKIRNAREYYRQRVRPLDPTSQPPRTVLEVAEIGKNHIRELLGMVLHTLVLESQAQRGGPDGVGHANALTLNRFAHVMHDALRNYFRAGLKALNKVKLAEDGATPIQTVRHIVRLATVWPVLDAIPRNLSTPEDRASLDKTLFEVKIAYGDADLHNHVYMGAAALNLIGLPHSVIKISGGEVEHVFIVLTPNTGDAADIGSEPRSICNLSPDWMVLDLEMNICCRGDQYGTEVLDKLTKLDDRGKVLLNHTNGSAWKPLSSEVLGSIVEGKLSTLDASNYY